MRGSKKKVDANVVGLPSRMAGRMKFFHTVKTTKISGANPNEAWLAILTRRGFRSRIWGCRRTMHLERFPIRWNRLTDKETLRAQ
jgi:hypothetical protein